jgi:large subunit ribosomal protein L4
MTSAHVLDLKGNKLRDYNLADEVFAVEPNEALMHTALVRQLANNRSGSANTKTRGEVRGGGAKPWRQKGTGRARAGSTRSPLWEGGGVTFGPKPRDFAKSMPRKMRVLAIRSALAARKDNMFIVQDFKELKEAKTKAAAQVLKALKIDGKKVLIVLDFGNQESDRFALAARNLAKVTVVHVNNLNVKDLLHCEAVLTTAAAVESISDRFKEVSNPKGYTPDEEPRKPRVEKPKAKVVKEKVAPKVKDKKPAASKKAAAKAKSVNEETGESVKAEKPARAAGKKEEAPKAAKPKAQESKPKKTNKK